MNSNGKPRQPKATKMNQAKTLLYDKETETWKCLKCEKEIHEAKCKKCTKPCNITQKERGKRKDSEGNITYSNMLATEPR